MTGITITNPGSGYTSPPVVSLSGGGGSGALATATLTGVVAGVIITDFGSGYTSAPTVTFSGGGGSGATGTAAINNVVGSVTLTNGGGGYVTTAVQPIPSEGGSTPGVLTSQLTVPDSLVVNDLTVGISITAADLSDLAAVLIAPDGTQVPLFAEGDLSGQNLTNTIFDNYAGSSDVGPEVTFSGGGGTGATGIANLSQGVAAVAITEDGFGYTSAPTVTFSGGGTTDEATGTVQIDPLGFVTGITITDPGSGYTSAPTVTISGGGGTGADGIATLTGIVTSITVTNGGSGYTSARTISLSGGGGTGAIGVATIDPGTKMVTGVTITDHGSDYTAGPYTGHLPSCYRSDLSDPHRGGQRLSGRRHPQHSGRHLSTPASLEVTSVGPGGVITGIQLLQAGSYDVQPGSLAGVVPAGASQGQGALFTLTFSNSLSVLNSKNYQGIWTLRVTNYDPSNAANLIDWTLNPFSVTAITDQTFRISIPTHRSAAPTPSCWGRTPRGIPSRTRPCIPPSPLPEARATRSAISSLSRVASREVRTQDRPNSW